MGGGGGKVKEARCMRRELIKGRSEAGGVGRQTGS